MLYESESYWVDCLHLTDNNQYISCLWFCDCNGFVLVFLFFFFFYVTRTEIIELLKRWIKQNKYGLLNPLFFPRTSTKSTVIIFFVKIFCSPNDHVSLSSHSPPPPQHFLPLSHSPQTSSIPTQMNRTRGSEQWGLDPFRSHPDVSFNPVISCNYSNGCRRWSDHICTRN